MTLARTSDLWWKNAVLYCLDVETFLDWNDDGHGDLAGLIERLDYLAGIGVSCLWLMPFQPSPNRDDGYDIIDYYSVDERLGTLGDFVRVIRTARDRGMRVIVDLVVNHTSDRHPWFRSARASRTSPFRDFYVWRDERPPEDPKAVVFPDAEDSIWTWDERAGQWYMHHFYAHQPELNIANPKVREEIAKIAGFWLELGVNGFRVDAVPFLLEEGGTRSDAELEGLEAVGTWQLAWLFGDNRIFAGTEAEAGYRRGDAEWTSLSEEAPHRGDIVARVGGVLEWGPRLGPVNRDRGTRF